MLNDYGFGEAWKGLMKMLLVALCFVPLGLWKLVEIVIWLVHHVRITW